MGFLRAWPAWARPDHPVFSLEAERRGGVRSLALLQMGCMPLLFAVVGFALALILLIGLPTLVLSGDADQIITLLSIAVTAMAVVQAVGGAMVNVLTIASTAPLVSGEVELQSWNLLRATVLPLHDILFAKLAAAIHSQRLPLTALLILRVISLVTALLLGMGFLLRDTFYWMSRAEYRQFWQEGMWAPIVIAVVVAAVFWVTQPLVQMGLNGAIGMLASVSGRTRSRAIASALAGRLVLWIGAAMVNFSAIYGLAFLILGNWLEPRYASIEAFRTLPEPTPAQAVWMVGLVIAGYILVVMASQIGLTLAMLGIAQRRARLLGG
ncbi:MAG: hypothetical protein Kow00124_26110 [Anaerolineae bacterium]